MKRRPHITELGHETIKRPAPTLFQWGTRLP